MAKKHKTALLLSPKKPYHLNLQSFNMLRILIIFLCFGNICLAQNKLPLWFSENFGDNSNRWDDVQEYQEIVRFNALYVHNQKDFRLLAEIDSRSIDPRNSNSWGLSWGRSDADNYYYFEINNNKEFRISYRQLGIVYKLIDWKESKHIQLENNVLEIEHRGENLLFSINGQQVEKMGFKAFFGSEVALRSSDKQAVWRKLELYQDMGTINVAESVRDDKTEKENLGERINSKYIEKFPSISPDGKTIYYLRENYPGDFGGQDIWQAERLPEGGWGLGRNSGRDLNNSDNNFVNSVMPDNNTLCVSNSYGNYSSPDAVIAFTHRSETGWTRPQPVAIRNLQRLGRWLSFSLSADGRTLVFSMRRPDSYGGRDIYVSFLQADGSFSNPTNLGNAINTTGNEHCPFLAADGKTLYFDTDGHPGYGGRDIFVTRRLDESWTNWSKPENMGPGINTTASDEGIMIPASGEYAYFVSNQNSLGALDIYRLRLPDALKPMPTALLRGKVIECEGKKAVAATMRVYANGKEVANARSNPGNGEFQLALPAGVKYDVVIETNRAVYAKNDTFLVDLTTLEIYEERDLTPYCIEKKDKVTVPTEKPQPKIIPVLAPVYFDYDKYELTATAKAQLDSAFQILSTQKELRIELLGHTDAIGPDDYNQTLSENRIQAVEKYLIEKGLEQNRITSRIGKGKKAPVADNNTPEGRAVNRRVELMLK